MPRLQPINVTYSSRNLAISSLLLLKLSLLAPPTALTIVAVDVFINQRFTAHYEETNVTARPRPRLYRLTKIKRDRSASRPPPPPPESPAASPQPSPGPSAPATLHGSPIPIPHPGEPRQRALRRPSLVPTASGNGNGRGSSPAPPPAPPSAGSPATAQADPEGYELDRPDSRDENQEQTWSRGGRERAVRLEAEEEWTYEAMVRLPTDETIRPSTLKGTNTPLVVTHEVSEFRTM